jgi:hypothetical protein
LFTIITTVSNKIEKLVMLSALSKSISALGVLCVSAVHSLAATVMSSPFGRLKQTLRFFLGEVKFLF